jgi:hypothetical protein
VPLRCAVGSSGLAAQLGPPTLHPVTNPRSPTGQTFSTKIQKYKDAEIQKYRNTMQKCRNAEMQKCRNAEMQKYRNTEIQKYRNTEIQKKRLI